MPTLLAVVLLLASPAHALSSLSGTVVDESKDPVNGARVLALQVSTRKFFEATSVDGRYSISGLTHGEFIVGVDQSGKASTLGAVRIGKDEDRELGFVLASGQNSVKSMPPQRMPVTYQPPPPGPGKVQQAHLIRQVAPSIPPSVKQSGLSGTVFIEVQIDVDGRVNDLVVLSAPHNEMAVASLLAVIKWRYSPARVDGVAVPVVTTIDVNFQQ